MPTAPADLQPHFKLRSDEQGIVQPTGDGYVSLANCTIRLGCARPVGALPIPNTIRQW